MPDSGACGELTGFGTRNFGRLSGCVPLGARGGRRWMLCVAGGSALRPPSLGSAARRSGRARSGGGRRRRLAQRSDAAQLASRRGPVGGAGTVRPSRASERLRPPWRSPYSMVPLTRADESFGTLGRAVGTAVSAAALWSPWVAFCACNGRPKYSRSRVKWPAVLRIFFALLRSGCFCTALRSPADALLPGDKNFLSLECSAGTRLRAAAPRANSICFGGGCSQATPKTSA